MTQTPYISVAVSLPVINSYTYKVPDHLKACWSPGMRVLVPFKNRRVTGYIISGQETCKGFKAKKILDILDDHPLFPESEISFFKWIAGYYIHPLGEVIKAALPSGLDRHDVSSVFVTQHGQDRLNAGRLTPGEEQVIDFILQRRACTLKQLKKNSKNTTINALIRRMEKEDLIIVSAVLKKDGAKIKKEKFEKIIN